jgi:hypothetical protein
VCDSQSQLPPYLNLATRPTRDCSPLSVPFRSVPHASVYGGTVRPFRPWGPDHPRPTRHRASSPPPLQVVLAALCGARARSLPSPLIPVLLSVARPEVQLHSASFVISSTQNRSTIVRVRVRTRTWFLCIDRTVVVSFSDHSLHRQLPSLASTLVRISQSLTDQTKSFFKQDPSHFTFEKRGHTESRRYRYKSTSTTEPNHGLQQPYA